MRGCIFSSVRSSRHDCYYCCSKRAAARRFFINAEFRSHSQLDEDGDAKNTEREWEGGERRALPHLLHRTTQKALHLPGYLATWHLARPVARQRGPATIIQAYNRPIPLLPSVLSLCLWFHSSHLRSSSSFSSPRHTLSGT